MDIGTTCRGLSKTSSSTVQAQRQTYIVWHSNLALWYLVSGRGRLHFQETVHVINSKPHSIICRTPVFFCSAVIPTEFNSACFEIETQLKLTKNIFLFLHNSKIPAQFKKCQIRNKLVGTDSNWAGTTVKRHLSTQIRCL